MSAYRVDIGAPVAATFAGGTVLCCPAWCQGPFLGQIMALLDRFDWSGTAQGSVAELHRVLECVKLAFSDREAVLGDPRHVDVPLDRLLSPAHLASRLALFDAGPRAAGHAALGPWPPCADRRNAAPAPARGTRPTSRWSMATG